MKHISTGKLTRHNFLIENAGRDMSIEQMFEQMYYNGFNEKGTQIGKIDVNIEQLSKNNKKFFKFWMQPQEQIITTMRYYCQSIRKVSKSQITEVKL